MNSEMPMGFFWRMRPCAEVDLGMVIGAVIKASFDEKVTGAGVCGLVISYLDGDWLFSGTF